MSFTAPRTAGSDLLTRTTLRIDANASPAIMAHVIRALHRVPGVLTAEANAATDGATVAHDAAVPAAALVAAAAAAGAHAVVLEDTRPAAASAPNALPMQRAGMWRSFVVAAVVFATLSLVESLVPGAAVKRWALPLAVATLWMFFVARAIVARHT